MQAVTSPEATTIPVIDISNAGTPTAEELINAVVQWGFVYIKAAGSGFTPELINETFQIVS